MPVVLVVAAQTKVDLELTDGVKRAPGPSKTLRKLEAPNHLIKFKILTLLYSPHGSSANTAVTQRYLRMFSLQALIEHDMM